MKKLGDMADTSASEQFSLRWNNFSSNLTSGFLSHLSNNDLVDVTLAVEGKLFQAHKLVLSVCSPYFKDIFKVNPCQHPVVILKDMGYTEVGSLLKFMYQGEVNVRQDDLAAFLKVAEILQIKGLTGEGAKCEPHDHDGLSGDTSDLPQPPENIEADGCLNEEITRNCSETNLPSNRTKVVDKAKSKRPPEATVSNSLRNKRCRTSPPPLKEMDIPTSIPEKVMTKAEPPDFDLHDDEFTLAEEPLDDSSIAKHVLRQDAVDYLKDDQNINADQPQQPSNSLTNLSCSQGDITQGLLPFVRSSRGNLQLVHDGHIYTVHCRAAQKTYWKCVYRSILGRCRARCYTKSGTVVVSKPSPPPHASHLDMIQSFHTTGKIIYFAGY